MSTQDKKFNFRLKKISYFDDLTRLKKKITANLMQSRKD